MKLNTLLTVAGAILGMSLSGAAFAMDGPSFDEVDTDHSGTISESEAETVADLDFAEADLNKDGVLSRSEYEQALS